MSQVSHLAVALILLLTMSKSVSGQTIEELQTSLQDKSAAEQVTFLTDKQITIQEAPLLEQIRYWYLLGTAYDQNHQIDKALEAFSKAIDLHEKNQLEVSEVLARSYIERSYMKYLQTYDHKIYCGDRFKALELARQLGEPELLVKILIQTAFCYGNNPQQLHQGQNLLLEAIQIVEGNDELEKPYGLIYNASAILYQQNQLFYKAYEFAQKAYNAWAEPPDYQDMFNMQHTLVGLAIQMQEYDKAQQHVDLLFAMAREQEQFSDFLFFSHYNAGLLAYSQHQYESAIAAFEQAVFLRNTTQEQHFVNLSLFSLVTAHFSLQQDASAQARLKQLQITWPDTKQWPLKLQGLNAYYAGNSVLAMQLANQAIDFEIDKRRAFVNQYQLAANNMYDESIAALDNKVLQKDLEINRLQLAEQKSQRRYAHIAIGIVAIFVLGLVWFVMYLLKTRRLFRHKSQTDYLTQVANRSSIFEQGYKLLKNAKEKQQDLSILIFDIDHFKKVNDTLGHEHGDSALKLVSERALGCLRLKDSIGRIGGEEFLILLPDTDAEQAEKVAQRIRREIEQSPLQHDEKTYTLTVSIGGATMFSQESLEAAIARADSALYKAKNNGRNQVVLAV